MPLQTSVPKRIQPIGSLRTFWVMAVLGIWFLSGSSEASYTRQSDPPKKSSASRTSSTSSSATPGVSGASGSTVNTGPSAYERHLDSLKGGKPKIDAGQSRTHSLTDPVARTAPSKVLTSDSSQSERDLSADDRSARDFGAVAGRDEATYKRDHNFLVRLSQTINHPAIQRSLWTVLERMRRASKLSRAEVDFLMKLSGNVNDPVVSERLRQIAETYSL